MTILLICVLLILIGIVIFRSSNRISTTGIGEGLIFFGGITLAISLIIIPMHHMSTHSQIVKFNSLEDTIENARNNEMYFETVSMQRRIAKKNEWLSTQKYWNDSVFDIWIPDEVEKLEPLE